MGTFAIDLDFAASKTRSQFGELNDYVVYNRPLTLVLHWIIARLITLILMGLAAAAILKKPRAA
jgi:hypothetical protein